MNEWEIAAVVLMAGIVPCVAVCVFASAAAALAALEVASTLATTALIVLSEGFHRQPFVDLAVVLAVLSVVGSLAFARLMEGDI
ncbi:MAG TPA: monovalent cation/H+ antiporter complex subunit F [Solirubrobacteraceae bacterium]|jgi:multisubunit Na+/H+ antiporter MnhF subunit|nr:monovalent cation/H+ antiporter complex subunit F [Solirubrobacteraceae bacterium]